MSGPTNLLHACRSGRPSFFRGGVLRLLWICLGMCTGSWQPAMAGNEFAASATRLSLRIDDKTVLELQEKLPVLVEIHAGQRVEIQSDQAVKWRVMVNHDFITGAHNNFHIGNAKDYLVVQETTTEVVSDTWTAQTSIVGEPSGPIHFTVQSGAHDAMELNFQVVK